MINPRFPNFKPEFVRLRPQRIVSWGIETEGFLSARANRALIDCRRPSHETPPVAIIVELRTTEMLKRHGPNSHKALAHPLREGYIRVAATSVAETLKHSGVDLLAPVAKPPPGGPVLLIGP